MCIDEYYNSVALMSMRFSSVIGYKFIFSDNTNTSLHKETKLFFILWILCQISLAALMPELRRRGHELLLLEEIRGLTTH